MQVMVRSDPVAGAAGHLAERIRRLGEKQDGVSVALSGGRTPWKVFSALAEQDLDWESVHVFQVDERLVPPGDPDRNLARLDEVLLSRVRAVVHPMPVDDPDPETAAERYARELPERFDLIHLGLGTDGHTASLVPGDAVLEVVDRDVAVTDVYEGHRRMTLTYPALDRADALVWIVEGESKRPALRRLLRHDRTIPAGRVSPARSLVITDLDVS